MKYHNHLSPSHPGSYWSDCRLTARYCSLIGQYLDTPTSCPLIGCWAAHSHRLRLTDRLAFSGDKMSPGSVSAWPLLSVLLEDDQQPNEEMMRCCNCSLHHHHQFQFTAMFGVKYSVSELWARFSAINVNLMEDFPLFIRNWRIFNLW